MNRAQKRATITKIRKKGYSLEDAKKILAFKEAVTELSHFDDGDKVCLRYNRITKSPDFTRKNPRYQEFVESHKNDIFTVKHVEGKVTFVELEEDTTDPKWWWHEMDLRRPEDTE